MLTFDDNMQEAQDFREEAQEEVKAKIIEEAPGGTLASGTGDVSTTGSPFPLSSGCFICTSRITLMTTSFLMNCLDTCKVS